MGLLKVVPADILHNLNQHSLLYLHIHLCLHILQVHKPLFRLRFKLPLPHRQLLWWQKKLVTATAPVATLPDAELASIIPFAIMATELAEEQERIDYNGQHPFKVVN